MSEICNNQNRDNQGKEQGVCDMGERVKTGNGLKLAMAYAIAALFPVTIILLSTGVMKCLCKSQQMSDPCMKVEYSPNDADSLYVNDTCDCNPESCWRISLRLCPQSPDVDTIMVIDDSTTMKVDISPDVDISPSHADKSKIVFGFIILVLLIVASVLMFFRFMKYSDKLSEQDAKYKERLTDEAIRILKEEEEYKRLANRAQISLLEKQGRAIMDEEVRAKEHQRKLDIMDRERIADLNDKVLEIVKAQVTSKTFDEKSTQQWIKELIQTISNLSLKIK